MLREIYLRSNLLFYILTFRSKTEETKLSEWSQKDDQIYYKKEAYV